MKIKVRPNCFRFAKKDSCYPYYERAAWFGRPFSLDWVKSIIKKEMAERAPNLMRTSANGYYTQFLWDPRKNGEVHLSVEELPYKNEFMPAQRTFSVRFIHAVFSLSTNTINHLDGALHIYEHTSYKNRIKLHLADFYKDYSKVKIFRIDEDLDFKVSQQIMESFFKWNFMVNEYFSSL